LLLGVIAWLWPALSQASGLSTFGAERKVGLEDFRPQPLEGEMYLEQWSHGVRRPDGTFMLGLDFVVSNLGIGDNKGALKVEYIDEQGKRTECSQAFDHDEWSSSSEGFRLAFGRSELSGDLTGLRWKVRCPSIQADLRLENVAPPVRPGGGTLVLEESGRKAGTYSIVFTSPRSRVTGKLVVDGKTIEIDGIGQADHSITDLAPYKLARRWFRFTHADARVTIALVELESPAELGGSRRGYALVYTPEGRLLASARVRFEFEGFIAETKTGRGYSIPRRVRFVAVDGESSLTGTLTLSGVREIRDPTASLDAVRRAVVRRFSKPLDFFLDCNYEMKIKKGPEEHEFKGQGVYRFVYVNP
jgi:hypothetical protein